MTKSGMFKFSIFLLVSIVVNLYLYSEKTKYQNAWLEQFITTSEVERLLVASLGDNSFEHIKQTSISLYGEKQVKVVSLDSELMKQGADTVGLMVNRTLLLFKDDHYYGSKANLPN